MRYARLFVVLLAVFSASCEVPTEPSIGGGTVAFRAPSGSLSVTPIAGPPGTQPLIIWETSAVSGLIQACEVQGLDCTGFREVARGTSGQLTDLPLPAGKWQYRLVGSDAEGISFVLDTKGVSIN